MYKEGGMHNQQQTVFSPLGCIKNSEDGLFITPLRSFHTTPLDTQKKRVIFTNPDDIRHHVKKANKIALENYLENKIVKCKKGLIKKIIAKNNDWSVDSVFDVDLNKIPLKVTEEYHKSIVSYKNTALLNYAEESFLSYIWKLESQHKYLVLQNNVDGSESLKLLLTRYHKSYCDKIKKRMDWLSHEYGNSSAVFLTLTLDPKKFNQDKFVMWKSITKEVDRFMKALRICMQREKRIFPKYLWAIEGQKNGNPHIHIVFFNSRRLIDWRKILSYWGNGAIFINRTSKGQKIRYPINYVTSYITKTFGNTNFDNIRTQSMIWLFNHHSFNRSKGLIIPLNPKGCGDWLLSYLAIVDRHNNIVDEMDIIWNRIDMMFNPSLWIKPPPIEASADQFARWKLKQKEVCKNV